MTAMESLSEMCPSHIVMENVPAIHKSDEDDNEADDEDSDHEVLIPRGPRYEDGPQSGVQESAESGVQVCTPVEVPSMPDFRRRFMCTPEELGLTVGPQGTVVVQSSAS